MRCRECNAPLDSEDSQYAELCKECYQPERVVKPEEPLDFRRDSSTGRKPGKRRGSNS